MDELQAIKAHLDHLAWGKPTPARRAEVEALLGHKWTGIQTLAAYLLGHWGGPESVSALRRWLGDGPDPREDALKALGECVGEDDVDWALDLYFKHFEDHYWRTSCWPLIIGLPRKSALVRLRKEAKPGSPNERAASFALQRIARHDEWLRGSTDPQRRKHR